MPQTYTAIEWLKLYTGSTGAHVIWERKKKEAGKVVDVAVFRDGFGPALDSFAKSLQTLSLARQKQRKHVKRIDGKSVYSPQYREVSAATDKAQRAMADKANRLERVVADYVKLCDTKKAAPADKLTKPTGPTAAAAQKKVWEALGAHLREMQTTISRIPEVAKMHDKYDPLDD